MHLPSDQGFVAVFTNKQAEGAWKNGTRVVKTSSDAADTHQDGAGAVIVGSLGLAWAESSDRQNVYLYFVIWDDKNPRCPVAVADYRLKRAS